MADHLHLRACLNEFLLQNNALFGVILPEDSLNVFSYCELNLPLFADFIFELLEEADGEAIAAGLEEGVDGVVV